MPAAVCSVTTDRVVRVNPGFTAAYGFAEDALGRPLRDLHFVAEDRDDTLRAFAEGRPESIQVRVRTSDGQCRWAQVDVSRFELDGNPVLLTTFYDIGERKSAERQLEERAATVAEMALFPEMNPGPVFRLDLERIVRRANPAAHAVSGRESLEGVDFRSVCPGIGDEVWDPVQAGEGSATCEVQMGDRWFSFTLSHEPGTEHLFVFGTDISELKEAESELEERARFPQMNPGPVARLDREGTVLRANPVASVLFGKDSLRGESWLRLCPGVEGEVWRRVFESGDPVQHEAEFGDRCLSFTLRHEPIGDHVFVYGTDVTELKVAQRSLSELARFPDMNPGPVLRMDREGRVLLANPAARRVFGGQDLTGRSWLELCPGLDRQGWNAVTASAKTMTVEAAIGGRHYLLTHARGPQGVFVFVFGSDITDQKSAESALRQSEKMATLGTLTAGVAHELNNPAAAAQRAAEQLEAIFAAYQLAYNRLHALQLPVDAEALVQELDDRAREVAACPCELDPLVRSDLEAEFEDWLDQRGGDVPWEVSPALVELGYDLDTLEALARRVGDKVAPAMLTWQAHGQRVYRLLEEIRQGSGRLVEIVGAMKAYAYLGQAPVQSVDVNEGIRNTLVILRSKLKQGITVKQELDPELPRIEAYGSELNQDWTNLLDNAADAMGGKGSIAIRTFLRGDCMVVEVEDSGPGVPPDIQPLVFDAFFTTKPPGKGTGLGLNTAYRIVVEKHGGSIRLRSEPGSTCFTIKLPLTRPEPTPEGTTMSSKPPS